MPKQTIGQKAERALKFLLGLRNPRVVAALAKHGFAERDLREGLDHLTTLTRKRLSMRAPVEDPRIVAELDDFENRWFQVARHALTRKYPEVADELFLNLVQTTGAGVAVTVSTFLERIEQMQAGAGAFGEQGPAAHELLVQRGLTAERIQEAKALIDKIGTIDEVTEQQPTIEEQLAAEAQLWSWYLEWSGIARVAIRDRRLLRTLGFRKSQRSGDEEVIESEEDGTNEAPSAPAAPALPPVPAAPQLSAGSTPAEPSNGPPTPATAA